MADLTGLIRVRKHTIEQKQKFLSELYRQAEELTTQKETMLEQLETERDKMQEFGVEMMSYFGPYSDAVKIRVADIDDNMKTLDTRIEIAREEMRAAYNELKKIEITHDRRITAEEKALNKKESDELDEIALGGFRRKQEEG